MVRRQKLFVVVGLAIGVCVCAVILVLLLRGQGPRSPSGATGGAVPGDGTGSMRSSLGTPESLPCVPEEDHVAEISREYMAEIQPAYKLSDKLLAWRRDESLAVTRIGRETFEQSLSMMADWETNYYKLTLQVAEPMPAVPNSLDLILYSRRFAKLLEETPSTADPARQRETAACLQRDVAHMKELLQQGQSFTSIVTELGREGTSASDLLVPLSFRINATILLIGQRSMTECLPEVTAAAEAFGDHANWAVIGYTCDKVLSKFLASSYDGPGKKVLAEYAAWKDQQSGSPFFHYRVIELPSYRSTGRPYERATRMGAPLDFSQGKVVVEFPPKYEVTVTKKEGRERYWDSTTNNAMGRRMLEFAKEFVLESSDAP